MAGGSERAELPEGPVTLLFTDIEGSTALRTSLGDAATDTLFPQHDEFIPAQIEEHRGHDQHAALGDGFLAVFVSTSARWRARSASRRALDTFNRQRSGASRVRIGLNTGEVAQSATALGRSGARRGAGLRRRRGGHVLVADVTRQLAGTVADITYRDTGDHDSRDFRSRGGFGRWCGCGSRPSRAVRRSRPAA